MHLPTRPGARSIGIQIGAEVVPRHICDPLDLQHPLRRHARPLRDRTASDAESLGYSRKHPALRADQRKRIHGRLHSRTKQPEQVICSVLLSVLFGLETDHEFTAAYQARLLCEFSLPPVMLSGTKRSATLAEEHDEPEYCNPPRRPTFRRRAGA